MLLAILFIWFVVSPIAALFTGAFIRAGKGPRVDVPQTRNRSNYALAK